MTPDTHSKRGFQVNRPQRIAAVLLVLFMMLAGWLATRRLSLPEQSTANCGAALWGVTAHVGTCEVEGRLATAAAGMPVVLGLVGDDGAIWRALAPWQNLLVRLPFLLAGVMLGGGLWWVTRRLFGNRGGYTALTLYCFSPFALRAAASVHVEILSALAVYGGVYTCIGVAHAMQGPRRKWRPRIVLLTVIFTVAVLAQGVALAVTVGLGLGLMLWIAEGRRALIGPVLAIPVAGALALGWLAMLLTPGITIFNFPGKIWFTPGGHAGLLLALAGAGLLYAVSRRSRFFGNSAPLIVALALAGCQAAGMHEAWVWAMPFLLTFLAGVAADAYESGWGRMARWSVGALVAVQVVVGVMELAGR